MRGPRLQKLKRAGALSTAAIVVLAGWAAVPVAVADSVPAAARPADAAGVPVYKDPSAPLTARVDDLLSRLTLAEKITLMSGGSAFATAPIPRLGIPAIHFSDGTNGVRSNDGQVATVFPTESAIAATWDPAVARAEGEAVGREARALNVQVMLGPDVNTQRLPIAGRDFETYSEDPYLAGKMGAAYVEGLQSEGVGATVKHFVGNEQELERMRSSSNIDGRTLREIYLAPFETIVKDADPWAIMLSYNRLNGTYMTENRPLVHGVLEGEWGYKGLVMSDWGAVHSTVAAASSGLDLEMPGPPHYFGERLEAAVQSWQVDESWVDEAARRVLRTIIRSGALDGKPRPAGEVGSARNRKVALRAASEAITLLKNERDLLPLDAARIRTLAVIGPDADVPLYEGGGSSHVNPDRIETPLSSLERLVGKRVRIVHARGVDNDPIPPPADARLLSPGRARTARGLAFEYFADKSFSGRPVSTGVEKNFDQALFASGLAQMSARWEGYLWPPSSGEYQLSLSQIGTGRVYVDGRQVIGPHQGRLVPTRSLFGVPLRLATVRLQAGRGYRIRIEYVSFPFPFHSLQFGVRLPAPSFAKAVQAARGADAAVVFVGDSPSSETEGVDRTGIQLYGRQNDLVRAVLAANPHTVVVLENGSPLALPWADEAPAIVEGWLDGVEGPQAMAQVLFGQVDPSGKLPMTFPKRLRDTPGYLYYSAGRNANYGEGVFVGYRYYDKRDVAPLFPFGHGLSYTSFRYDHLSMPAAVAVGRPFTVSLEVTNTGQRAGMETVELYVGDEATTAVVRPEEELKGFRKVSLSPGQTQAVTFTVSPRDLSYYDVHAGDWVSTPGPHRILIGSSSRDIRLQQGFDLTPAAAR
jgi:beta-glucosidase